MSMQMFKELFNGTYDGVSPPTLLPTGCPSGGMNVRKIGSMGGWKTRRGASLHNTIQISDHEVKSLVQYTHPRNGDYHFLAQINNLLYKAANNPTSAGTSFGSAFGLEVGDDPIFWDIVKEHLFCGDGLGGPITWGGDTPFCSGFVVRFDSGGSDADTYVDFRDRVVDNRSDTYAVLRGDADDEIYVCSPEIADEIHLSFGSVVNTESSTLNLQAMRNKAWTDVSGLDDGTASGGASFAQDGTISWTKGSDELSVIEGRMGYWYKITFSASLTSDIEISKVQVHFDPCRMTNKWNGVYEWVGACRLLTTNGEYADLTAKVTNESTAAYANIGGDKADSSSYLMIKTPEPITGIGLGIVDGYENSQAAEFDKIEARNGQEWVDVGSFSDGTHDGVDSSAAQTGLLLWNASGVDVEKTTFAWDSIPGYWYRISWDASFSDDTRVWGVNYIPYPEDLAPVSGCIEFKGRLFAWGDPKYPNRFRYSAEDHPDCFCGSDSGYTEQLGDMDPILAARKFYNELLVWKKHEVYLLEGFSPSTFGSLRISTTVGIASPQTAQVVEVGSPMGARKEPLSMAIWQEVDGIYALDGKKPRKISQAVDNYFNPDYTQCIPASDIRDRQAFIDRINNEYHLLLSSIELVYNFLTDEWYPPWERQEPLVCGLGLRGTDRRWYTYGGLCNGYVMRLEHGWADKNTDDEDYNILSSVKTRAISAIQDKSPTNRMTFRRLWLEAKALGSGSLRVRIYGDLDELGSELTTPERMSLVRQGHDLVLPFIDANEEGLSCFQLEFIGDGVELWLYSMLYQLDARGELSVAT